MARDQNTFAKRRREMEKKRKAEAKLEKRRQKKQNPENSDGTPGSNHDADVAAEPLVED